MISGIAYWIKLTVLNMSISKHGNSQISQHDQLLGNIINREYFRQLYGRMPLDLWNGMYYRVREVTETVLHPVYRACKQEMWRARSYAWRWMPLPGSRATTHASEQPRSTVHVIRS